MISSFRLASCTVLLLLLAQSAAAGGIKGSKSTPSSVSTERRLKKKNKIKGPKSRSCTSSTKKDEVKFECKTRTGGSSKSKGKSSSKDEVESRGISLSAEDVNDKIKYNVRTTTDGIQVQVEYKHEVDDGDVESKSETEFQIVFENLVEYVKGDSEDESEAYNWDQDEIVQTVPLSSWVAIPGINSDGDVSYFTATTAPSALTSGTTSFNFTVSQADKDEHITANSMKIDVKILDFPWTRSDSYVALMSTVESKKKVKVEYDEEANASKGERSKKTEEVTVSFGDDDMESSLGFSAFGEYTWDEDAEASTPEYAELDSSNSTVSVARQGGNDNVLAETKSTIQVVATSPSDDSTEDGRQRIAYSFVGDGAQSASEIYWDPEAGIGYESAGGRLASFAGMALTLVSAFCYSML